MSEDFIKNDLDTMRHSAAHLMAAAVQEVMKERGVEVQFAIGPVIDNGFYYDFDMGGGTVSEEDFKAIEKKMKHLVRQHLPITREELSIKDALKRVTGQKYKEEIISDLAEQGAESVSFYKMGEIFDDLCRGPHVEHSGKIGPFKILKTAGAYWRGDENNPMLQRLYATAFATQEELDAYLGQLAEAEKRDHRKVGKQLDLFVFSDLVGPGLPLYTPKGALLRGLIANYSREFRKQLGYQEVHTPQINKAELFRISGHYDKYKDDMFRVSSNYSDEEYFLKPMNCPQHTQMFASHTRSYRELPIRYADFANLYRDEKPGELSGLTRLRCFSQDDAHCFCREDQIADEFSNLLDAISQVLKAYDMSYYVRLSLWDPQEKSKYLGDDAVWEKSQELLENLLKDKKIDYVRGEGEAAFYGPKMDIMVKDALNREWQVSTIQIDFNLPERFELDYVGEDGEKHRPVMIHSALVGSPERFMGILIEHFGGAFPVWLSPVQTKVLLISDKFKSYGEEVVRALKHAGIRVELDDRAESIGKKIREGEIEKTPYLLIVGEKELSEKKVAVRKRGEGDTGAVSVDAFIQTIMGEISRKK